jgi:hypothetical protein
VSIIYLYLGKLTFSVFLIIIIDFIILKYTASLRKIRWLEVINKNFIKTIIIINTIVLLYILFFT